MARRRTMVVRSSIHRVTTIRDVITFTISSQGTIGSVGDALVEYRFESFGARCQLLCGIAAFKGNNVRIVIIGLRKCVIVLKWNAADYVYKIGESPVKLKFIVMFIRQTIWLDVPSSGW
jgi:hypothetical protein